MDPKWKPDFGPAEFNEKVAGSGATAISARDFLIAYNVNLNTTSTRRANAIAFDIREAGRIKREGNPITGKKVLDENGEITELRCTYDPKTKGGWSNDGRKVKGTLHWVSAQHAVDAEVRLYNRLFTEPNPTGHKDKDFREFLNPESLQVITAKLEPSLAHATPGEGVQFERKAFFCRDKADDMENPQDVPLVFNRIVELRDRWAKIQVKQ